MSDALCVGNATIGIIVANMVFTSLAWVSMLHGFTKFLPMDLLGMMNDFIRATTDAPENHVHRTQEKIAGLFQHFNNLDIALLVIFNVYCVFGFCGLCIRRIAIPMLGVYVTIMSGLIVAQAVTIGLLTTGKLDELLKTHLTKALVDNYKGNFDLGIESLSMNTLQGQYGCCGVNDWMDYVDASHWNRAEGFNVGDVHHEVTSTVPVTCCRFEGEFPKYFSLLDEQCPETPTLYNSFMLDGCYDKIRDTFQDWRTKVLRWLVGLLVSEFLCMLLGIYLLLAWRHIKEDEEEEDEED
ncbi:hypothetical protein CAPTEDRAFT_201234 [Capitella teleta]|uniref:Tetraspanin n=1 Tax=Capitella teleta TaxID=283909 RepID=R7UVI3_CAPTE|nr:hypothetical protein CAPTEDRAFT_201234 [Capitella teleta]|eukprot:ELU10257.1 hypothetical protein CAPTEDRAFT_201234 [Capitella teleta]